MRINLKPAIVFFTFTLTLTTLIFTGCVNDAVGTSGSSVGVYVHGLGELRSAEPNDMTRLMAATEAAAADLGYTVSEHTKDPIESRVVCTDTANHKIKITMENTNPNRVELHIRVGLGDEKQSIMILEKIHSHM